MDNARNKILIISSMPDSSDVQSIKKGFTQIKEECSVWGEGNGDKPMQKITDQMLLQDVSLIMFTDIQAFDLINPEAHNSQNEIRRVFWLRHYLTDQQQVENIKHSIDVNRVEMVLNASHTTMELFKNPEKKIKSVWFPLAVDPDMYPAKGNLPLTAKKYRVLFSGSVTNEHRDLLTFLDINYNVQVETPAKSYTEFQEKTTASVVHFIISPEAIILPDIFATMLCGTVVATNPVPGLESLVDTKSDLIIYKDKDELRQKISLLLNEKDAAIAMCDSGRNKVLNAHTYAHRANNLLHILGKA